MKLKILILLPLLFLVVGCVQKNTGKAERVSIDNKQYTLEIAQTEEQRTRGLGGRPQLTQNAGMIFIFAGATYLTFWMKDTLIPLQILFVNGCEIVDVQEMAVEPNPASPQKTYKSKSPADKAIELNTNSVPANVVGQEIEQLCQR